MTALPPPSALADRTLPRETVPLGLLLITLLALVLRLHRLGEDSFWVDELITLWQGSVEGYGLWEQFLDDLQNPLPMVLVTWMRSVSESEAWLRLPGAVLGALSPWLLFRVGRRVMGPRAALFAALLLAIHPFHLAHCQEVRGYPYLVFFGLAATDVALAAGSRLTWRRGLVLLGLGVATILSNLQGLFWMGGLALGLVVARRVGWPEVPRWALVFGLMLVVTANWWSKSLGVHESDRILPGTSTGEPLRGETTFTPWAIPYAGLLLTLGEGLGPSTRELQSRTYEEGPGARRQLLLERLPGLAIGGGLVLLVLGTGVVASRRRLPELLAWGVFVLAFALLLALRNVKPFNPRYVMAVLPALLLLLGAGFAALPRRIGLAVLFAWLTLTAISLRRQVFDPAYHNEDVRAAARLVAEREGDDDVVLVPTVYRVFEHYFPGESPVENLLGHRLGDANEVATALAQVRPERRFLWYVRSRPWFGDPRGDVLDTLRSRHREVARFESNGVEMLLFDRDDPALAPAPR